MSELTVTDMQTSKCQKDSRLGLIASSCFSRWLDSFLFSSLLGLMTLVAIPYGTVEPWWVALYQVAVFSIAALAVTTQMLSGHRTSSEWRMFLPLAALLLFLFLQSVPLPQTMARLPFLNLKGSISSDPFETRLLFLKLLALAAHAYLLIHYTSSRRRLLTLVQVVIGVAGASALFGIVRQALQHSEIGFVLPYLRRGSGFGQFINKNHFAFLLEMGIGVGTGFLVAGGVKREHRLFYLAALLVMWVALVQTASRGAIFSLFTQLAFLTSAMIWLRAREESYGENLGGARRQAFRPRTLTTGSLLMRVMLGFSLITLIGLGTVWLGGDLLVTRMEALSAELKSEGNDANAPHDGVKRREVWGATWLLIRSSPVVGAGFGAYGVAITRFHKGSGKWVPEAAHNDYLELLSSGGIIGVALFAWLVAVFIARARIQLLSVDRFRCAASLAALTGLLGVLAHSVVDFGLHVTANAVVFVVLVVIAIRELPENRGEAFLDEASVV